MELSQKCSNFSQFSDDLWMIAEHDGTRIEFDVDQNELLTFAQHLVDVAIDCLRKSKQDTDTADNLLCEAMDEISKANATLNVPGGRATARTVQGDAGNSSWRAKASVGLIETRTVGDHNVRVYADRLAIWRKDGQRLTWAELQAVKCEVWGDRVAVEVYPAQGDVVNLRHTRHLWTGLRLTEAVAAECTHVEFANDQVEFSEGSE